MCSVEGHSNECVLNSECVGYRCKCSPGFNPTFSGECYPDDGQGRKNNYNFGGSPIGKPINLNVFDTAPLAHFHEHQYHNQLTFK